CSWPTTYWSRKALISLGLGRSPPHGCSWDSASSSSMISLHSSMHSSQMYTPGPAMSFLTCFCDLPQNEHFNRSPPSPIRATHVSPLLDGSRPVPAAASAAPDGRPRRPPYGLASTLPRRSAIACPAHRCVGDGPGRASVAGRPTRTVEAYRAAGPARSGRRRGGQRGLLPAAEHDVDQPVLLRPLGRHDLVSIDALAYPFHGLTAVLGDDVLKLGPHPHDLPGLDLDVRALAVAALHRRLVDDDAGVGQRHPLARRPRGQQHRGRARGLAQADRLDLRPHVL